MRRQTPTSFDDKAVFCQADTDDCFAFIKDLEHLRDKPNPSNEVLQHLLSSGLVTFKHTALCGGFDSFDINLNQYGVQLREILRDAG